jgi:hypothetical protein
MSRQTSDTSARTSFNTNSHHTSHKVSNASSIDDQQSKILKKLEKSNYGFQRKIYNGDDDTTQHNSDGYLTDNDQIELSSKLFKNDNDDDKYKSDDDDNKYDKNKYKKYDDDDKCIDCESEFYKL